MHVIDANVRPKTTELAGWLNHTRNFVSLETITFWHSQWTGVTKIV